MGFALPGVGEKKKIKIRMRRYAPVSEEALPKVASGVFSWLGFFALKGFGILRFALL
jgi:hypothetical protein